MKKFYNYFMICAIALVSAISFTSCKDDDAEVKEGALIGTWESISYSIWEKEDGVLVYEDSDTDADVRLVFKENNTVDQQELEGSKWVTYNTYEWRLSGNQISVREDSDDEWETSTIEKLDSKNLIITSSYKEMDEGTLYEGFERTVYRKL